MRPFAFIGFSALLLASSALVLGMNGCGGESTSPSAAGSGTASVLNAASKIQHVVIIVQENRTPDNLFHDQVLMDRGADIVSTGLNSSGDTVPLQPLSLGQTYDLSHKHSAFLKMYDSGKMDGADKVPVVCPVSKPHCGPPLNPQFAYVKPSDVQPYFDIAEQYTFGDRMFQTNEGPSYPAHQFILSGTSAPTSTSSWFDAENPGAQWASNTGCTAPSFVRVPMINRFGYEKALMYPCFEHSTLPDLLDAKKLSWRYYAPSAGSIWTAPNTISHLCGPTAELGGGQKCASAEWTDNVVLYTIQNPAPILVDIAKGGLPAVSWVIPASQNSDHSSDLANVDGPSWVAAIVNAIGGSSYWRNTAILITWDDWGGWYDHVPPPQVINDATSWGSGYVYGFRVPLIVVSPYAKAQYISHVTHDFGSILHFIETIYNLPSLGYADARADDLSDCFDFSQQPLGFQMIAAPKSADHFLHDQRPAGDPDDD